MSVTATATEKKVYVSTEQQTVLDGLKTTSAKIRYLTAEGLTRSQIAATLNIIYQHVRNVQLQPLKRVA